MNSCLRCGYDWEPRKTEGRIRQCPYCHSSRWESLGAGRAKAVEVPAKQRKDVSGDGGENRGSGIGGEAVPCSRRDGGQKGQGKQVRSKRLPSVGGIRPPVEPGPDKGVGGDAKAVAWSCGHCGCEGRVLRGGNPVCASCGRAA